MWEGGGGEGGGGRMDGWMKQNPPDQPRRASFSCVNVNMHRAELSLPGEDGGEDGGMARRNTLRALLPGCAACF